MTTIKQINPILMALDLDMTIAFYRDRLGFEVEFVYRESGINPYASLVRNGCSIKFRQGSLPTDPSSYGGISIEVEDVDEMYFELQERGAFDENYPREFSCIREHPPEDKEYGVKDMFLVDPNGYVITYLTPLP
ncbi:MAG: VOC family protein [Gammaproteobacteria bacterium]|nr:VOC family protein [Gammaproteobacteria bacterium]